MIEQDEVAKDVESQPKRNSDSVRKVAYRKPSPENQNNEAELQA